jgi:hypothetical protein
MRTSSNHVNEIPSLRIAQVERARFKRTGSRFHLAHAQRALEAAQNELVALSRKCWRDELMARLGGDVPGLRERN